MTGIFKVGHARRAARQLSTIALLGVSTCNGAGAIIDDYRPVFALLYGSVRLNSGNPASDVLVRSGDGVGTRTDAAGRFRLLVTLHGVGPDRYPLDVKAYRTRAAGAVVDSVGVVVQIPFSPTSPPRDSVRLDLITSWEI